MEKSNQIIMAKMQKDVEFIKATVAKIEDKLCDKADKEVVDGLTVTVERLKAFRWQIIAGISVIITVFEFFGDKIFK